MSLMFNGMELAGFEVEKAGSPGMGQVLAKVSSHVVLMEEEHDLPSDNCYGCFLSGACIGEINCDGEYRLPHLMYETAGQAWDICEHGKRGHFRPLFEQYGEYCKVDVGERI